MGGVFDDPETVLAAQGVDGGHVAWLTGEMHGDHHLWQRSVLPRRRQFF